MATSRNTIQRELVYAAVQALKNHPTADEIYAHVAAEHPHVSRATVYRNLSLLARQGAIRRVSHLNAADRFDFELAPHYHFRCDACGSVYDAPLPYDHDLLAGVQNADGFVFERYELVFGGLCPHCGSRGTA